MCVHMRGRVADAVFEVQKERKRLLESKGARIKWMNTKSTKISVVMSIGIAKSMK